MVASKDFPVFSFVLISIILIDLLGIKVLLYMLGTSEINLFSFEPEILCFNHPLTPLYSIKTLGSISSTVSYINLNSEYAGIVPIFLL